MIPVLGHHAVVMPLQLAGLFAEPLVFIAVWLFLGWFLLQESHENPATNGDPEVVDHRHHAPEVDGLSGLQLVLLVFSLYYLFRYWRNR